MPQDFATDSDESEDYAFARRASKRTVPAPDVGTVAAKRVRHDSDSATEDEMDEVEPPNKRPEQTSSLALLPQEILNMIFALLLDAMAPLRSVWMRARIRREHLLVLWRIGRLCLSFYDALATEVMQYVALTTAEQCRKRLKSAEEFKRNHAGLPYPSKCLHLRFEAYDPRILIEAKCQLAPMLVKSCIEELGPSLQCVSLEIDPGTVLRQSRFFEGAETEQERRVRTVPPQMVDGLEMQTALNAFEAFAIRELHLCGTRADRRLAWRAQNLDEGSRLRSLRSFVQNSFTTSIESSLTNIFLSHIVDGWQLALRPFTSLRCLRLDHCGPALGNHHIDLGVSKESLNRLSTLEIEDPERMPAPLICAMAQAHSESLQRFVLVTSSNWTDFSIPTLVVDQATYLLEGLQREMGTPSPPDRHHTSELLVAGQPVGNAIVGLLKANIAHLILGGPQCISADIFETLLQGTGAPQLRSLGFCSCAVFKAEAEIPYTRTLRHGQAATPLTHGQIEEARLDELGITADKVANFVQHHAKLACPKLENLEVARMPDSWLWYEPMDDHRHPVYNAVTSEKRAQRRAEKSSEKSHLEQICEEQGIRFQWLAGDF